MLLCISRWETTRHHSFTEYASHELGTSQQTDSISLAVFTGNLYW